MHSGSHHPCKSFHHSQTGLVLTLLELLKKGEKNLESRFRVVIFFEKKDLWSDGCFSMGSVECYDQLVKGTNLMPFSSDWTPSGTTTKSHNLSSKGRETQNIIGQS